MKEVHGLEIPQISLFWALQRAHHTEPLAKHKKQWEKLLQTKHSSTVSCGKTCPLPSKPKGFSWFLLCTQHRNCMFVLNVRKKRGGTEKRAENPPPLLFKKEGREEEGPSNTLLGNTESLLPLHKNEVERDLDNNRNSHFRSQCKRSWLNKLKWTKNHFL